MNIRFIFSFGWPYIRRYRSRLILGIVLGVLYGLTSAMFPWAVKTVASRMMPPENTSAVATVSQQTGAGTSAAIQQKLQTAQAEVVGLLDEWLPRHGKPLTLKKGIGCMLFLPIMVFFRGFFSFTSGYCMKWASERMMNDMRFDVLRKLHSLSLDFFHSKNTGDLMMRLSADIKALYYCLYYGVSDLVKEPISIVGILAVLLWIDPTLTLFSLVFLPMCMVPIIILGRKTRKAGKGSIQAEVNISSLMVEGLTNIREVKAFGLETAHQNRFRKFIRTRINNAMRANRANELLNPLIEVASALATGALLLFAFYSGRTIVDLLAFAVGLGLFYNPVKRLAKIHLQFQKAAFGVERLRSTFAEEATVKEADNATEMPEFIDKIAFNNVTFAYGKDPVLRDFSLEVPRGHSIGIAGESGSGKSTLINLLFRFYDVNEGSIKIDGRDIREVKMSSLRDQIALVSQETLLFDATVKENIGLGRHSATDEEIRRAARSAGVEKFIDDMPEGYETEIGERGVLVSGGQRQRLAIARAFVRSAPILMLDEATAALDSETEEELQKEIDRLAENRTVFIVAHRLSTLRKCDRILVLEKGRIVESGGFDELVSSGGAFSKLAAKQGIVAASAA